MTKGHYLELVLVMIQVSSKKTKWFRRTKERSKGENFQFITKLKVLIFRVRNWWEQQKLEEEDKIIFTWSRTRFFVYSKWFNSEGWTVNFSPLKKHIHNGEWINKYTIFCSDESLLIADTHLVTKFTFVLIFSDPAKKLIPYSLQWSISRKFSNKIRVIIDHCG